MKNKLERIIKFAPAWDKRNSDPKKDFGIHCVQGFMVVKGKKGAVHFIFATGMYLPDTLERLAKDGGLVHSISPNRHFVLNAPMGYDVGYHSLIPRYDGQEVMWPTKIKKTGPKPIDVKFKKIGKKPPNCEWLGVPCYCDGSALRAEEWMNVFIKEGSDKIWEMLEEEYKIIFK